MGKKILFVAGSLNQGGAEFQLLNLAKLFKDKGHEVKIYSLTRHDFYRWYVDKHGIPTIIPNEVRKTATVFRLVRLIRSFRPDILVSYLRMPVQVTLIARILSCVRCKFMASERTSLTIPNYDKVYFNLMRFCSVFTVNSISKIRYIEERFPFLKPRLFFTPNIIECPTQLDRQTHARSFFKVVYVGRISKEKNVLNLIKAFKLLSMERNDIVLELHGDSKNPEYLQLLKHEIGASRNVEIKGQTHNIGAVYKDADLLCLLSKYEGFSNVLSEALCYGLPVVASNIPENAFLVEHGKNGFLVNGNDINAIKKGINQFLELDRNSKEVIRKSNYEKARAIFDRETMYQQYNSMLALDR